MREHVLLFCLLGLVLTAAIILVSAPGTVTWALSLMIDRADAGRAVRNCIFWTTLSAYATSKRMQADRNSVAN